MPLFPESPRCLSPFQGNLFSLHCLDFQAEDRHRHIRPWHVGQPFGKASRERHRSLDPCEEKRDTAATAWEVSARACPHSGRGLTPWGDSRSTPRSMSALERNPQVPAPTPHKVLGPGIRGEESREAPEQLAWGLAFPEATRAGPCVPGPTSRAPAET